MIDIVTMHQVWLCFFDEGCEFAHRLARVDQRERAPYFGETAAAPIILVRHKMRLVRRLDIPAVLHRKVDDFCPSVRQKHSFLEQHGLCAAVVEKKFIGDQYFHPDDQYFHPDDPDDFADVRRNWRHVKEEQDFCAPSHSEQDRETLPESCPTEVSNSEVPTRE